MQIGSNTTPSAAQQQPAPGRFRVLLHRGPAARTQVLSGSRWTVGRNDDCDVQIGDPAIAPLHMVFEAAGDLLAFRDLTGTGRVWLDGKRCRDGQLATGSTLLIGTTRLTAAPLGAARRTDSVRTLQRLPWARTRGPAAASVASFDAAWLEALQPLLQPDFSASAGSAREALEACMDALSRDLGLLARIDDNRVTVLASVSRRKGIAELHASQSLLRQARAAPATWTVGQAGKPRTRRDQLVVPVGHGAGILVLALAAPGAPPPQPSLPLARLAGEMAWLRLQQAAELERCRDEFERRRPLPDRSPLIAARRLDELRAQLRHAARHGLPVMLVGERGTETEELGRYLHLNSDRATAPFVTMHAGAMPPKQQGAELLGSRTGIAGAAQRAGHGTLFLEQPEALTPQVQERLVRLLRRRALNCRLVCASTLSPEDAARRSRLHMDLASRLAAIRLQVPPLRSNPADILPLAECILADLAGSDAANRRTLSQATSHCLLLYSWPGNVDELRDVLTAAVAQSNGKVITPRLLPAQIRCTPTAADQGEQTLVAVETRHILQVLELFDNNKRAAAKALGIATSTLYEKLKRIAADQD